MQNAGQFKVGDKFVVIRDYGSFKVGDVVTLEEDDGTNCPLFINKHGKTYYMDLDDEVKPWQPKLFKLVKESVVGEVGSIFELVEGHSSCDDCELYKLVKGKCEYNNASDGGPGAWIDSSNLEPYVGEKSSSDSDRKMTPFEEAGYTAEDKFEIIGKNNIWHGFDIGTIVILSFDTGTENPEFKDEEGLEQYVNLEDIRKIEGTVAEENNMISFPCPEGYVFDGVRKLNKGDFQLDVSDMTVEEWRSASSSHGTYIVLKKKQPETLELKFERVPGSTINNDLFYTDSDILIPESWVMGEHTFKDGGETKIWKRVE